MALKRITDYAAATTPLAGTEIMELDVGGVPKKATVADVRGPGSTAKTLQAITSASSVTPAATDDVVVVSALAANLAINAPAGTPTGQDTIVFKIKDNGTTRTLTWDAAYVWMVTAVTATTVSKWHYFTAIYNATDSKWHITGSVVQP